MRNAIILHGRPKKETYYSSEFPSSSNFAWIPWLKKQLITNEIKTDTPEIPHAYEANYKVWKNEFESFDVNEMSILVGHSAGAGFLVRWLSEKIEVKIDKLILVAVGFSLLQEDLEIIDSKLSNRVNQITIFVSDNDPGNSIENTKYLCKKIDKVKVVELKGFGHFIPDHMGTSEFSQILEEIL
jgi:predicted alpha/beta hydrolase family esterase